MIAGRLLCAGPIPPTPHDSLMAEVELNSCLKRNIYSGWRWS
jgi:hypothetical protein